MDFVVFRGNKKGASEKSIQMAFENMKDLVDEKILEISR